MAEAPNIKAGDEIQVYQWRGRPGFFFKVETSANPEFVDDDYWAVAYKCPDESGHGQDYHYATWNEEKQRWEDGEF